MIVYFILFYFILPEVGGPFGPRKTIGTLIFPPDMYNNFAAELTI